MPEGQQESPVRLDGQHAVVGGIGVAEIQGGNVRAIGRQAREFQLPAGLEIVNTNLAVSGINNIYDSEEMRRRSYWFQHQNFRDNRAEAFTMLLSEGVWNYSYIARATTPGNFVVPPAKAEEMYAPETFGRSKTNYVRVE